ncbi:MAG: transposase [Alphaproteobacteria bacterium]|jgi:putative transposase|nr:transposase [Rhodospirillaceae bacterium]MDP6405473.1 transposase [Alphaproteobacteria bacterium]|tara:strand:- start:1837 stop:2568 length:732 start_codon:yes stop_codon:yes gene_type:complete
MPRRPRLVLPGQPLHIVQRGHNGTAIFRCPSDYRVYLRHLARANDHGDCAVHAYVLMSNHVHLVVTPACRTAASRLMKSLGQSYVRYVNDRYQRRGTLWQDRFYSCLIDSEAYLLACYRYVERNPVRAGMVADAADYPWSSYGWHGYGEVNPLINDHPLYEALGSQPVERQRVYRQFLSAGAVDRAVVVLREATRRGTAAASVNFKRRLEAELGYSLERRQAGRPRRSSKNPSPEFGISKIGV